MLDDRTLPGSERRVLLFSSRAAHRAGDHKTRFSLTIRLSDSALIVDLFVNAVRPSQHSHRYSEGFSPKDDVLLASRIRQATTVASRTRRSDSSQNLCTLPQEAEHEWSTLTTVTKRTKCCGAHAAKATKSWKATNHVGLLACSVQRDLPTRSPCSPARQPCRHRHGDRRLTRRARWTGRARWTYCCQPRAPR